MRRRELLIRSSRLAAGIPLLRSVALAEAPGLKAVFAGWEKQIPGIMRETNVPGVSIAVLLDAQLRWRRGFGVADVTTRKPVDAETVFQAASMSKPVFAYLVMKLAEKGVLDLDTPLTKYTSDRFLADDPKLDLITARHVLSHSTGFPNWRSSANPLQISFNPGEKYGYSGEGYFYLQSVVTRLTGRLNRNLCLGGYEGDLEVCASDIAAYMQANLLQPLRMKSSGYVTTDALERRMARPHNRHGEPLERGKGKPTDPARYAAAGGLLTTPTDYAKFLLEIAVPSLITRNSIEEMVKPNTPVMAKDGYTVSWALGWRVVRAKDGEFIGHGGDNPGFHCLAELSRARKSGFVIMTNGDGGVEFLQKFAPVISEYLQKRS